jgi:hypothetical protein
MKKEEYKSLIKKAVAIERSHIADVSYDAETQILSVTFSNGSKYDYCDVPEIVNTEFLAAESKGKYFNESVRKHFQGVKVADGEPRVSIPPAPPIPELQSRPEVDSLINSIDEAL